MDYPIFVSVFNASKNLKEKIHSPRSVSFYRLDLVSQV